MIVTISVAVLAVSALIALLGSRVSLVSLLVVQLTASVFGMWLLVVSGDIAPSILWTYGLAMVGLVAGRLLATLRHLPVAPVGTGHAGLSDSVVWSVIVVSAALAFYHLLRAGIPILSSDVEVERFDFTSSGLFGIPGRMYLFGVKIAWIVASANAAVLGIPWTRYRPWWGASAALLVISLLSGFKGQIPALASVALMVWIMTHRDRLTYWNVVRRFWPVAVGAVAYFLLVAGQYGTYQGSRQSVLQSSWERWTIGSAQAPSIALGGHFAYLPGNSLVNDVLYYAQRYAGIGPGAPYSLDRAVSASITHANPASTDWVVPVTVGGYSELVLALGIPLAVAAMVAIGWYLGVLETDPRGGPLRLAIRIVIVSVIMTFVVKGGLVYAVLNWAAVALILFAIGALAHVLLDRPRAVPRDHRPPAEQRERTEVAR